MLTISLRQLAHCYLSARGGTTSRGESHDRGGLGRLDGQAVGLDRRASAGGIGLAVLAGDLNKLVEVHMAGESRGGPGLSS